MQICIFQNIIKMVEPRWNTGTLLVYRFVYQVIYNYITRYFYLDIFYIMWILCDFALSNLLQIHQNSQSVYSRGNQKKKEKWQIGKANSGGRDEVTRLGDHNLTNVPLRGGYASSRQDINAILKLTLSFAYNFPFLYLGSSSWFLVHSAATVKGKWRNVPKP